MMDMDTAAVIGGIIGSVLLIIAGIQLLAPIAGLDPWRIMILFGVTFLLMSASGAHYLVPLVLLCLALLAVVLRSVL